MHPPWATFTRLLLLSSFTPNVVSQTQQVVDPLAQSCRRFGHQTTVIDNRLYIDGGLVDYGDSADATTVNYTNTYLLYLDLDEQTTYNFPTPHADLVKPNNVPSVQGGILWADTVNKLFYMYGGEYNWTSSPPAKYILWQYDALYNLWNAVTPDISADGIQSGSYGAGTVIDDDRAMGYYYGGWLSNATNLGWNGNPIAQSGLIQYDMLKNSWKNVTFIDSSPRAEGVMMYIPASDSGMLVYFGGVVQTSNGSYTGVPMNQIYLYDVTSNKYYTQTTSGYTPPMRRRFCGGVSWPDDHSSYNIYFYGGLPPYDEDGVGYGDVWILSIPSFTWIQWYPLVINGTRGSTSPSEHHSLSCNVLSRSQMSIIGGAFPNSSNTDCDSLNTFAQHNLALSEENVAKSEWYQYLPNITNTYDVPSTIIEAIGGGPTGGATLQSPAAGWGHPDLGVYFTRTYSAPTRTPTRSLVTAAPPATSSTAPKPHSLAGPIAGGVVGGVVVLALLICIIWVCRRRRTKKSQQLHSAPSVSPNEPMMELPTPDSPASRHKRDFSGSSAPHIVSPTVPSPPPPPFNAAHWSQPQPQQPQPHDGAHAPYGPPPPAQQFYAPPPQAQPYYPPPPAPQQYEPPPSTPSPMIPEMPSMRSPQPRMSTSPAVPASRASASPRMRGFAEDF
ncbi:hypothetical protein LTR53_009241 [Teratosphaeriaceae sp. CCFEE 6253]|nr:hypothetical protein LTR53_009241 [Teratosphaeriaceae sp. CCFEE 6253]